MIATSRLFLLATALALLSTSAQAQFELAVPMASKNSSLDQTSSIAPGATRAGFSGGSSCSSPTHLPPGPSLGSFAFDNSSPPYLGFPTNPLQAYCNFFGETEIANEEWYAWTATTTGVARFSTCGGLSAIDTKIAVYAFDCANLDLLDPLACKDDTPRCSNLSTILAWDTVAGESYLIQLGTSLTGAPGASDFTIEELPPRSAGQLDLGASDNALALVSGGEIMWMQTFEAEFGTLVTAVETAFGSPNTVPPLDGNSCAVAVYAGTPDTSLTLLSSETSVTSMTATDTVLSFPLTSPAYVTGTYTVAAVAETLSSQAMAPLDQTVNSKGRAWIAAELQGAFDLTNPSAASTPPTELQSLQPGSFDGVFLLRVQTLDTAVAFADVCNGDGGNGTGCTDCPCANNAHHGSTGGCINSTGAGARLYASGSSSVLAGDLLIQASGAPANSFSVLVSGNTIAPASSANPCFGLDSGLRSAHLDGLRCVVQQTQRHGGRAAANDGTFGFSTPGWGPPNAPLPDSGGLPAQGGFTAGQARHFQVTYRDFTSASCGTGLNTTQAVSVLFSP